MFNYVYHVHPMKPDRFICTSDQRGLQNIFLKQTYVVSVLIGSVFLRGFQFALAPYVSMPPPPPKKKEKKKHTPISIHINDDRTSNTMTIAACSGAE